MSGSSPEPSSFNPRLEMRRSSRCSSVSDIQSAGSISHARGAVLNSSELAEPAERQLYFGTLQLMNPDEMLETHPFETGPAHIGGDLTFQRRRRDDVVHAAADPDRDIEEIGAGLVVVISDAEPIVIDAAQVQTADIRGASFRHHRAEQTAALGAAGKTGERYRPVFALRPILAHLVERRAQHCEPPWRRIEFRFDRCVGREDYPTLGIGHRLVRERLHPTRPL